MGVLGLAQMPGIASALTEIGTCVLDVIGPLHRVNTPGGIPLSSVRFDPADITINAYDRIVWYNTADGPPPEIHHKVIETGHAPALFETATIYQVGLDHTDEYQFCETATYSYKCDIHPDFMRGTITVV